MDPKRFDSLTRALGQQPTDLQRLTTARSRRAALQGVRISLTALVLTPSLGTKTAATARRPRHRLQDRADRHRQKHDTTLKQRRHQQRQDSPGDPQGNDPQGSDPQGIVKGISFVLDNTTSHSTVFVEAGEVFNTRCCRLLAVFQFAPGQSRLFDTSAAQSYARVANTHWIEFSISCSIARTSPGPPAA